MREEVGLCVPVMGRTGSFGDGLIEGFHDFCSIDNASREDYPRDEMVIEIDIPQGEEARVEGEE